MGDQSNEEQFFIHFYEKQFPQMWNYALSILGNPDITDEAVQDAFVEALLKIDYLMTMEKPEWWLRKTVRNKAHHLLRDKARELRRLVYLDVEDVADIPGTDELEKVDERESDNVAGLKRQISKALTQEDLQLLILFLRMNTTYERLAQESGLSITACQKRIQRIRKRLKKYFSKNYE